jgi:hypothetical protein
VVVVDCLEVAVVEEEEEEGEEEESLVEVEDIHTKRC